MDGLFARLTVRVRVRVGVGVRVRMGVPTLHFETEYQLPKEKNLGAASPASLFAFFSLFVF